MEEVAESGTFAVKRRYSVLALVLSALMLWQFSRMLGFFGETSGRVNEIAEQLPLLVWAGMCIGVYAGYIGVRGLINATITVSRLGIRTPRAMTSSVDITWDQVTRISIVQRGLLDKWQAVRVDGDMGAWTQPLPHVADGRGFLKALIANASELTVVDESVVRILDS